MTSSPETIIEGSEIPSVPEALRKILVLADDPGSSSKDLERLVLQEPGLVTYLLKTVNSAYFGPRREISSVHHAIVMLGFLTVKSIASGLALIDAFNNIPGLNKRYVLAVWRHSLTCAGLVKVISGREPRDRQDDLFLSAMVRDMGHLVLAQYFKKKYDVLTEKTPFPSIMRENTLFQTDHAEIGALLLDRWRFPPRITELVRSHHRPDEYSGDAIDLDYLKVCDHVSAGYKDLAAFLERPEGEVDPAFLADLTRSGWSWEDLRGKKDLLLESVDLARQIISGA